ncbi:transcription factor SRM1-like [Henckelia pumila]|uniref:transcription factor SRM1-like n=1 Tax=Henckelia pumila TaxID=405737 RepID=UPI003C6E4E7E
MYADLSPMALNSSARWDWIENKIFENYLVQIPDCAEKWQIIAQHIPGKSPEDVKTHYEALVYDVWQIDTGKVQPPIYPDDETVFLGPSWLSDSAQISVPERKKGTPWTKDEHRLFLIGLQRYGKGDWRSISRNVIVTKTPTQVASHAQKYFLRQSENGRKQKKRSSIHDITMSSSMDILTMPARPNLPVPGQTKFQYFPSQRY